MRLMRPVQAAWRFSRRPRVFDITLVLLLVVVALIGATANLTQGRAVFFSVILLASALPLLMRRSRPLLVAALVLTVDLTGAISRLGPSGSVVTMIAFYGVGRYAGGRTAAGATAVGAILYGTALEVSARMDPGPDALGLWLAGAYVVAIPAALGQLVRVRAELRERAQQEAADSAVRAERRRIARELHDVVSHHLSVINALVGGARATLPPGQEVTREALSGAEQSARQALSEMRQLLDVLRADDGGGADAATGVGAARLPALVEEVRTAGLPASLIVTGEPVPLPTTVDHAVYRIVQEALTNTRKHAEGARASIRLVYDPTAIEVEVLDDGTPKHPVAAGFGLGGMAERVALCGGQLWTGPRLGGGFRVHARIPLEKK
ncbi:sensor histidine kinase [Nonomuraea sp. SBT364]|uniref:sensor histidine kinase n=1 Tax=Nonomuraea sp. SBT364 TaxID=1580530 RepID=UPI00069CE046|nr:histidine kinase [Nonomuraea sp. SBT364]